jgi:hypothetical protein
MKVDPVLIALYFQIAQNSSVSTVQISVLGMHLIEFRLEFKPQCDFFFMVFVISIEVFL